MGIPIDDDAQHRSAISPDGTALRHNAVVYDSDDEYVARAVPFLTEGLEAGEGAIVAHNKPGIAMMRDALGAHAAAVTFVDVGSTYTRPARTLAADHKVYVEQLQRTPMLRAVADVQVGADPREWDLWTGYEAVFNRCFAHLPAWVLCTYNANGTPDPAIEGVWQTHPEVVHGNTWTTSGLYEDPDHLLRRIARSPEDLPGLRSIPFGRDIEQIRERLAAELIAGGLVPHTHSPALRMGETGSHASGSAGVLRVCIESRIRQSCTSAPRWC